MANVISIPNVEIAQVIVHQAGVMPDGRLYADPNYAAICTAIHDTLLQPVFPCHRQNGVIVNYHYTCPFDMNTMEVAYMRLCHLLGVPYDPQKPDYGPVDTGMW